MSEVREHTGMLWSGVFFFYLLMCRTSSSRRRKSWKEAEGFYWPTIHRRIVPKTFSPEGALGSLGGVKRLSLFNGDTCNQQQTLIFGEGTKGEVSPCFA